MEKNYKLVFEYGKCVIYDKNNGHRLVTTVPMTKTRLFPLKFGGDCAQLANVVVENKNWLSHIRYGHLRYPSLRLLTSVQMVHRLPKIEEEKTMREGCALGKHLGMKFPRDQAWRASYPLQLVHSDICGSVQTQSIGKNSYFLTFINDCIRMCWIYLLTSKDQAFECFNDFKTHVEKQSECVVK